MFTYDWYIYVKISYYFVSHNRISNNKIFRNKNIIKIFRTIYGIFTDKRLYERIIDSILVYYLEDNSTSTTINDDENDDNMNSNDEEENEMKMKHVNKQKVANYIFQYASDANTIDSRRQSLY